MTLLDPRILAFLGVLAAVHWWLPPRCRRSFLLVSWMVWLAAASPLTLIVFGALAVWVHVALRVMRRGELGWRRQVLVVADLGMVALVIAARFKLGVLGWLADFLGQEGLFADVLVSELSSINLIFEYVGLSYVVLRAHHLLYLVRVDPNTRASFADVLHYFVYLPTVTCGPIMRWREYRACGTREPTAADIDRGLRRIITGLFKKIVLVRALAGVTGPLVTTSGPWGPLVHAPLVLMMMYLDFSGYSDMAIGAARLFGHEVPENFKRSFSATSMSHFWRGWHATLGDWLREHIFVPLGGMTARRERLVLLLLVVMLFCGLWHALELRFLIWGAFHGAILAVESGRGIHPLPRRAPAARRWMRSAVVLALAAIGSLCFVPEYWTWDSTSSETGRAEPVAIDRSLDSPSAGFVPDSLPGLGWFYYDMGNYETAEGIFRDTLEMRQKIYGKQHLRVMAAMRDLIQVLQAKGDDEEADAMLRKVIAMAPPLLVGKHPMAWNLKALVSVLRDTNAVAMAEPLYREALAVDRELLGDEHSLLGLSLTNLALVLERQGKYVAAEPLFREALALRQRLLGDRHPDTLESMNNIVEFYEGWGKPDRAAEWRAKLPEKATE